MFCLHKDKQDALKSLEKSNIVLEKSGKPQSDFYTNPVHSQRTFPRKNYLLQTIPPR